jgi:hypothetical protein
MPFRCPAAILAAGVAFSAGAAPAEQKSSSIDTISKLEARNSKLEARNSKLIQHTHSELKNFH